MNRKDFFKAAALAIPGVGAALQATAQSENTNKSRSIDKVAKSSRQQVAPGFYIRRAIPGGGVRMVDPFLLLDHMGPQEISPGKGPVVPPHPHRGFEPVTFLFEGNAEHKDSQGNHAVLQGGDVQWMTAGAGIVHSESMGTQFVKEGGTLHGVQLWVNLPKKHKMTKPGYQNLPTKDIPKAVLDDGKVTVRVVSGNAFGLKGPAKTFYPLSAMNVILEAEGSAILPMPEPYNTCIYVLEGELDLHNGRKASEGDLVVYNKDGDQIQVAASKATNILVLGAEPINEPVASYGPFVMNTMAEIRQAIADYQAGKMGKIDF